MSSESEPLESYYASSTLGGLIRSGLALVAARRVRSQGAPFHKRLFLSNAAHYLVYALLIIVPACLLDAYQRLRSALTGGPRVHPQGSWQYYLHTGLREDQAHHTNETVSYHTARPPGATELDDLTAWVMAVIQLIWNYDELMGTVWDEWTMLRLVTETAREEGLADSEPFAKLQRRWEVTRPYHAPLNGTYADVRRAAFHAFIKPCLEALPSARCSEVLKKHEQLAQSERESYQAQMSLLATMQPGRYEDVKRPIPLWNSKIGIVARGRYYLIDLVDHNEHGEPIAYGQGGRHWEVRTQGDKLLTPVGDALRLEHDQLYREEDGEWVGYLDMAPVSRVKGQLRAILEQPEEWQASPLETEPVDLLLAETPRREQARLRRLLPPQTRASLNELARAPVIINWDERQRSRPLAELRRTRRGVGDHALTIMRTDSSFVFDQSHVFFDGTWSLAMAEVLTNAAVRWCERCITIAPAQATPVRKLVLEASPVFLAEARALRETPEISAETTIFDISNVFALRKKLAQTGTRLTINDLLVITRILHAAHYRPSASIQAEVEKMRGAGATRLERSAVKAIDRSLQRGRVLNPALLIPVDASPTDPRERVFPITFRNLADSLVWLWDDAWEAYQAYRRIEPPNTPEGVAAFRQFALRRTLLIGHLRAFSHILAANKAVAMRGDSFNIAILKLLVGLPAWLQHSLKAIPEYFPFLNEIIRGDEVYSNVGRVAEGSSLSRFMTAKDDGNTKALAWGVMTDDKGRLIVTMRDFRPHVKPLVRAGRVDLASRMAFDYVVGYTADLIGLVARLSAMLQAEEPHIDPTHDTI